MCVHILIIIISLHNYVVLEYTDVHVLIDFWIICFQGRNKVRITEVTYCKESITPDNVYIIDNGLEIVQVNLVNRFSC